MYGCAFGYSKFRNQARFLVIFTTFFYVLTITTKLDEHLCQSIRKVESVTHNLSDKTFNEKIISYTFLDACDTDGGFPWAIGLDVWVQRVETCGPRIHSARRPADKNSRVEGISQQDEASFVLVVQLHVMGEEDEWVFRIIHGCGAKTRNVSVRQNHFSGQTILQVVVIMSSGPVR